jgi:hypothetical protein
MKKILGLIWMLAVAFSVGTVITLMLLGAILLPKMKLDGNRVAQIAAIAQGADYMPKEETKNVSQPEGEQPSYQEIVEARALKLRNLELREQQLRNNLVQVLSEEGKLADDIKRQKALIEGFNSQVAELRESSTSAGMADVLQDLEAIKPKQAKAILVEMLDKKEIDKVVVLLRQMAVKKCAAIIGEFKTDEELEKISEVLRRLREGLPEAKAAENAQAQMKPKKMP